MGKYWLSKTKSNFPHKFWYKIFQWKALNEDIKQADKHQLATQNVHNLRWPSSAQPVHGTSTYKCDDTRGCIIQFWPPDDEHMVLETCRGMK